MKTDVTPYQLEDANQALDDLRSGKLDGAAVLTILICKYTNKGKTRTKDIKIPQRSFKIDFMRTQ